MPLQLKNSIRFVNIVQHVLYVIILTDIFMTLQFFHNFGNRWTENSLSSQLFKRLRRLSKCDKMLFHFPIKDDAFLHDLFHLITPFNIDSYLSRQHNQHIKHAAAFWNRLHVWSVSDVLKCCLGRFWNRASVFFFILSSNKALISVFCYLVNHVQLIKRPLCPLSLAV